LPTETLDIVVTADKLDTPTVYRRTLIAHKARSRVLRVCSEI